MPKLLFAVFATMLSLAAEEFDSRLSIHTIVREDVFAGFLENDMDRLSVGEKRIDALLAQRPQARPDLLAWKAGVALFRAIKAHEAKQPSEYKRQYALATDLFRQGKEAGVTFGFAAVQGGTYATLADRLPEVERAAGWADAYEAYRVLYKAQEKIVDKLPLHLKGELLAGLAMSAQRTGKADEAVQWTDRIIATMPDTPYAARATTWKKSPNLMGRTGLACQTCHDAGRLAPRQEAVARQ
jgi:hypothetical protein